MQPPASPPSSPDSLLARCHAIAGLTLGELADMANVAIPTNLQRHKGWPGMLIEKW
ncbi:MAG TPA: DNA mismatch repair endonuclease MutH, partial [Alteromonas macleodii]|nr:DNA mismatch repair endonuclease MutH [Alteromonas macleodii]